MGLVPEAPFGFRGTPVWGSCLLTWRHPGYIYIYIIYYCIKKGIFNPCRHPKPKLTRSSPWIGHQTELLGAPSRNLASSNQLRFEASRLRSEAIGTRIWWKGKDQLTYGSFVKKKTPTTTKVTQLYHKVLLKTQNRESCDWHT